MGSIAPARLIGSGVRVLIGFVLYGIACQAISASQEGTFGIRIIVVGSQIAAEELRARLVNGADFDELARAQSIDPSSANGGFIGNVELGQLRREFETALEGVTPGGFSSVTRIGSNYAVLQLLEPSPDPAGSVAGTPASRAWATAVIANDVDQITELLVNGANVDARFDDGSTALVAAAFGGHTDTVDLLLGAGADVNATTRAGATALMAAALGNHPDIVRALLNRGADVNRRARNGATALMEAAYGDYTETVRALVQGGADVNLAYDDGATVLMAAVLAGNHEMVRILLDSGGRPNASQRDGGTALIKAAGAGDLEIVRDLVNAGADVNQAAVNGSTALIEAAFSGRNEVVNLLLGAGADPEASLEDGSTVLMAAALGGHTEIVHALMLAGADVQAGPGDGSTALMEAAYGGHTETVRSLIAAGSDVNLATDEGMTALMASAMWGYVDTVRLLLDAGANPDAVDRNGRTAMSHATAAGSLEVVEVLRDAGEASEAVDAAIAAGTTYANDYYVSGEPGLLDRADIEFRSVLEADPDNLVALEWMGALEVLRWDGAPAGDEYGRAMAFFRRAVALDPGDADRHYWIETLSWQYASGTFQVSREEYSAILDEGIEHGRQAVAIDPFYWEASVYLELLYRLKADAALPGPNRDSFLDLADDAHQTASATRSALAGRLSRPDDQFSRPAPPPPPPGIQ